MVQLTNFSKDKTILSDHKSIPLTTIRFSIKITPASLRRSRKLPTHSQDSFNLPRNSSMKSLSRCKCKFIMLTSTLALEGQTLSIPKIHTLQAKAAVLRVLRVTATKRRTKKAKRSRVGFLHREQRFNSPILTTGTLVRTLTHNPTTKTIIRRVSQKRCQIIMVPSFPAV